jgi:hypothetical protein
MSPVKEVINDKYIRMTGTGGPSTLVRSKVEKER